MSPTHSIVQASLELGIIPLPHSESQDYRHMLTDLAFYCSFDSIILNPSFYTFSDLTSFVSAASLPHPVSPTTILLFYFSVPIAGSLDISGQCDKSSGLFILLESNLESW